MQYTIQTNISKEITIKKSKFITLFYKVNQTTSIKDILNKTKQDYKGANHYCYAYIIGTNEKCSDDGEPSGTAGLPILNVLKSNHLNNVLCIVVRYFGGIKLGAGGLIRAYSKTVRETLKEITIIEEKEYIEFQLHFSYEKEKEITYLLKEHEIINKEFEETIRYTIKIEKSKEEILIKQLIPLCIKLVKKIDTTLN